jgi:hypothetical protein
MIKALPAMIRKSSSAPEAHFESGGRWKQDFIFVQSMMYSSFCC